MKTADISGRGFKPNIALYSLLMVISCIASWFLLTRYTGGDQIYYSSFYQVLSTSGIGSVVHLQKMYLGASEPLYGMTMWIGSNLGIDRILYNALFSGAFVTALIYAMRKYGANWPLCLLMLSNYYVVVLITSAERLKFSYLIVILALLAPALIRWALLGLAPLFHFQTLISYASAVSGLLPRIFSSAPGTPKQRNTILGATAVVVIICASAYPFISDITAKFHAYYKNLNSILDTFNIIALWGVGLTQTKRRFGFSFMMSFATLAAIILGPDRVNMIAFFMFIWYLLSERRGNGWAVYAVMVYLSAKTIPYIFRILEYGNGFFYG